MTSVLIYVVIRELELVIISTFQADNLRRFPEVGENKQLLIAIVANVFIQLFYFLFVDLL